MMKKAPAKSAKGKIPAGFADGGKVAKKEEGKAHGKSELAFLKKGGAPKSMLREEAKDYGMKMPAGKAKKK